MSSTKLRKQIRTLKSNKPVWIDQFPAVTGKADGTILTDTAGMIWIQSVLNGQEYQVYNTTAPTDRVGLHVMVGRMVGEIDLRIISVSKTYGLTGDADSNGALRAILENLFIGRERFLPFLIVPTDGGGMVVQVFGDTIIKADGSFGLIANQTLDLTSHIPVSGALYALIEADDDGVLYVIDGTAVASVELLTLADIPSLTSGRKPSCAVRLYYGQTQLYRDIKSVNDFVDLRSLR